VFVVGLARPRTQHSCHHDTKVKPEAATAAVELLMMGGGTPNTCWAVNTARPRTQHSYHHDRKVKPEAAAAVVELLMMGGGKPETWAVNKRQGNKLEN